MKKFRNLLAFFLFFVTVWGSWSAETVQAQVFLEFSWTLENVSYEGLLFVPAQKRPTMTVRVLDVQGNLEALVLESVELRQEEDGTVRLLCSSPKILWGDKNREHLPETFAAGDKKRGKVTNGKEEALYEIDTLDPSNIEPTMKKYLLDEIQKNLDVE